MCDRSTECGAGSWRQIANVGDNRNDAKVWRMFLYRYLRVVSVAEWIGSLEPTAIACHVFSLPGMFAPGLGNGVHRKGQASGEDRGSNRAGGNGRQKTNVTDA